jgi:uncharacterized membrane protein
MTIPSVLTARSVAQPAPLRLHRVRRLFGPLFILAGILHFAIPRVYESIVPDYLPAPRALVYASGVAEIAGGAAVLHPRTRRFGSWWSIATLLAVFPANLHMALHPERYRSLPGGRPALLARLPLQAGFIAWARAAAG